MKTALIGYGYWGPNLARNFASVAGSQLACICDLSEERLGKARLAHPGIQTVNKPQLIFDDTSINLVLIATPVSTHYALAKSAILAGKDVLVEKPLATNFEQAAELVALAEKHNRILAVDHTFLYTGAIQKIKEMVDSKALGSLVYLDSIRVNLGLFQQDVNVLVDLAPHDLSILCHLTQEEPEWLKAMGSTHNLSAMENQVYLHVNYRSGLTAHFHWNWLAPVKLRLTSICGTEKMIVYDDMERSEKVRVYDKGVSFRKGDMDSFYKTVVDYRTGDMLCPKLSHKEALQAEAEHVVACVKNRTKPLSDGAFALRVMRLMDAAERSLKAKGDAVSVS